MALQNLTLIALRTVKHSERLTILTAYSREAGRVSLSIPAGSSKGIARLNAMTMPLSLISGVADIKPGREISPVRQLSIRHPLASLHGNPLKMMTAMFVAETLTVVLRDNDGDTHLFDFIESAIQAFDLLDNPRGAANFHLWFLYRLAAMLGIEPDSSTYTPGAIFDTRDGLWRRSMPLHGQAASDDASRSIWLLSRMTLANINRYSYTRSQRNDLLDGIIAYYTLHLVNLSNLKTLPILRDL